MNRYKFSEEEVPYGILEQFGLTREMIGDLPMDVLQAIHSGRRSPILPIRIDDSDGNTIHARTRFSLVRREDGTADVLFYPVLVESRLERFSEEQKQRLLEGKAVIAPMQGDNDTPVQAFHQIDSGTKQILSVPTPVIGRNLQIIAEKQLQALTDWGTNYANRKCYNTFASIVAADFDLPKGTVVMDGNDLAYINPDKGWFREGRYGREVTVDQIRVEPAEAEGKYRMTAVIDGETVSHEITQKQYDKFMVIDDYHRLKLFSKIFGEVDMKSRDNVPLGTKIGAALLAGVAVMGELGRGPRPDIYLERHGSPPPRCYFKPGVDTPMDVAARNYEAAVNTERMQHELRHGM